MIDLIKYPYLCMALKEYVYDFHLILRLKNNQSINDI
jgi:hypothetical protein